MSAELTDRERAAFVALADVLAPGGSGLPSASEVKVGGSLLDRALGACPDVVERLRGLLARVDVEASPAQLEATVRALASDEPELFEVLALVVTGTYTMSPRVRRLLGYPGQRPAPPYPDEADFYLDDDPLAPVRERGPIYRR